MCHQRRRANGSRERPLSVAFLWEKGQSRTGWATSGHVALSRSLAPSVAAAAPAGCSTCAPRDVAGGHHPSWLATLSAAPPAALPRRGRRRRSRSSPSASALCNSWDDVLAEGLPCLASERLRPGTLPALDRWRDHDYLVRHLPDVTVHEATPPTVQLMSEVQPLASELAELAWHRPWRERNISSRHLFRSGALDDASFGADGGGNHARQLSAVVSVAVEAPPRRGDTLAPAAWQMLRASLLEDLACKVVKARRVEAVLLDRVRWLDRRRGA